MMNDVKLIGWLTKVPKSEVDIIIGTVVTELGKEEVTDR